MLQIILGVIRCISDFEKPCVSKTADLRVKDTSRSLCYPVYVAIVFHLVKQSAKPLGSLFSNTKPAKLILRHFRNLRFTGLHTAHNFQT